MPLAATTIVTAITLKEKSDAFHNYFSLSLERFGRNDFNSFAFSLSCGSDLKRLSLDELSREAVGDCQLAISLASFSALRVWASSNCCRRVASLFTHGFRTLGCLTSIGPVAVPGLVLLASAMFAAAGVANAE